MEKPGGRHGGRRSKGAITRENYKAIAAGHEATSVDTKLRRALEMIAERSRLGRWVDIDLEEAARKLDAFDEKEAFFWLQDLLARRLVEHNQSPIQRCDHQ